jgi:threonylcarbamoyladenosine tRNA methylthiotransferase MtaB
MKTVNPSTSFRINSERSRTIKFYTLGCKVNQYETQKIREDLLWAGFKEANGTTEASLCVINTCTVTQRADKESLACIRRAARENPGARIVVTGCLTELDKDKIKKEFANSLIVRNRDKDRIVRLLNEDNDQTTKRPNGITFFKAHTRAFLKIQDGCDNCCSYCKVPLARGNSVSRPLSEIVEEAGSLVENGFKEIVLTGICLGAYGKDLARKSSLVKVIEALEKLGGLSRIRLSSIEAGDVSLSLVEKLAEQGKLCPHLHIPIQSGDDRILKLMSRRYTGKAYLALIERLKLKVKRIAITTDVLVGFPGEDNRSLENTLSLLKIICPLKVHIFPYSPREGTRAARFLSVVDSAVARKMAGLVKEVAEDCSWRYRKAFINEYAPVLIERKVCANPYSWEGYSDNYIKVRINSRKSLKNRLIRARLKELKPEFIEGEISIDR